MTITCKTCGKVHFVDYEDHFTECDCGAAITKQVSDLLFNTNNCVREAYTELSKRTTEGLCSEFTLQF